MVGLLKSIVRRLANVANFCKKTTVDKELVPVGLRPQSQGLCPSRNTVMTKCYHITW